MRPDVKEAICPECMADTVWELQDSYRINNRVFSERLQVCVEWCGWSGATALFPWAHNEPMDLYQPPIGDPFADAVPMVPPSEETP